ncbi:MAG TPA: SDR family NAD(P)-dependent oxidoreductase [Solirubrobacteraceae bacterium]|nr:SDR family NAD(P)-dependent oxidoreductase [Solirubrobacteraceae bacterium]
MNLGLEGRVAAVTGAAGGIGRACAKALADEGCRVIVSDVQERGLEDLVAEGPETFTPVVADLLSAGGPTAIIDQAVRTHDRLDILVMAAGVFGTARGGMFVGPEGPTAITAVDWDRTLVVNLRAAFLSAQAAIPVMARNRWGRLIAIGSVAGQMGGLAAGADYAASKAGLAGTMRSLALNAGRFGITANTINPGVIETGMIEHVATKTVTAVSERTVVGRNGTGAEVAAIAVMLASEQAGFVTGTHIDVNGGFYFG